MTLSLARGEPLADVLSTESTEHNLWMAYKKKFGIYDAVYGDAYMANLMCHLKGHKTKIEDHMQIPQAVKKTSAKTNDAIWLLWAKKLAAQKK